MAEIAEILLIARDLTQAAFRSAEAGLNGLEAAAGRVSGGLGGLGNSAAQALGFANLQSAALAGTLRAAQAAITGIGDSLNAGINREAEELNAVTTATKTLGLEYKDATKYIKNFYEQVSILGRDLPTSAEAIAEVSRTIQDEFALGLKPIGKTADEIGAALIDASTKAALLGDLSNTRIRDTRSALAALTAGSIGPRGLNQYKFFADNTLLKNALIDNLKSVNANAKSFADVNLTERVNILIKSLNSAISDDDIQRLQGLSKSKLSQFMDQLFDPNVGIFSIQRDLDPKIDGYQSVYSAFSETLDIVIGDGGIFWELFRVLGVTGDVMIPVRNAVLGFNNWLRSVQQGIQNLAAEDLEGLGQKTGMWLSDFLFGIIGSISKAILGNLPGFILFAGGFLLSFLLSSLKNAGGIIISLIAGIPKFVYDLFIVPIAKSLLAPVKWVADGFNNILVKPALELFLSGARLLKRLITGVMSTVTNLLRPVADSFGISIDGKASTGKANNGLGAAPGVAAIAPVGGNLPVAKFLLGLLPKYAGNIPTAANGFIPAIDKEMANAPSGAKPVIANSSEYILTQSQMQNLVNGTGRATVNFNAGAIVMNLPGGTAQEIAMQAIAIIEQALQNELEVRLA